MKRRRQLKRGRAKKRESQGKGKCSVAVGLSISLTREGFRDGRKGRSVLLRGAGGEPFMGCRVK